MTSDQIAHSTASAQMPLVGDPSAVFGDCVSSLAKVISVAVDLEMERSGLRPNEFAVMRLFSQRPEWTATQLVKRIRVSSAEMTRLVDNLAGRRLLRRRRSKADRRVVILALTDQGSEMIAGAHARIISYQAALLTDVSDLELKGFFATARKAIQSYTDLEDSAFR